MGRPTDNPLIHDVKVRLDKIRLEKLDKYCSVNKATRAEVIRHALDILLK